MTFKFKIENDEGASGTRQGDDLPSRGAAAYVEEQELIPEPPAVVDVSDA